MEIPGPWAESELQPKVYTTATATPDLSCICNLCCSLWQWQTLTHWARPGIEPTSSWTLCWVLNATSHNGNSSHSFLFGSTPSSRGCDFTHTIDLFCFPRSVTFRWRSLQDLRHGFLNHPNCNNKGSHFLFYKYREILECPWWLGS